VGATMKDPFIKLIRSQEISELLRKPKIWTLLSLIAYRAKRTNSLSVEDLEIGEAKIGDLKACGLSRQEYRTALNWLSVNQIITIRTTNKGTIAKLSDTRFFDINIENGNDQNNHQTTTKQPSNNHQATTNKNVRKKKVKKIKDTCAKNCANGFNDFWKEYPKKRDKQKSLKAWKRINPDNELQEVIIAALQKQKKSSDWLKESGQYIPYPSTWLNNERWNDELSLNAESSRPHISAEETDKYMENLRK
jgi:hypothetical protein